MAKEQEKKPKKLADNALLSRQMFDTLVKIRQVKSNENGKWYTIITIGKEQDITYMVCGRKDGKGTTLITDHEEFQRVEDRMGADVPAQEI